MSDVSAQKSTPYDVHVSVLLTLHGITSKVGQYSETIRAELVSPVDRHLSYFGHNPIAPHLFLSEMGFGHYQEHDWSPVENVVYYD